jgi:glycosyltransferase involved in cell wall biosynthesis
MLKAMRNLWQRFRRRDRVQDPRPAFDPVYYLRRYPDLAEFQSADAALDHYLRHGMSEGRFPNAMLEEETHYRVYLEKSDSFDLVAYKALNPDLRDVFSTDREFILHYIRHGQDEGRPATFAGPESDKRPLWMQRFSVSQFAAWMSDSITPPTSHEEAIEQFERNGIQQLAPLRFDHAFDPIFYRAHNGLSPQVSDADLYRSWLLEGLPQGKAPNEGWLLLPYIGELPFPPRFDWSGYAEARSLPSADRASALIHLFEHERDWDEALKYLGTADAAPISALARWCLRRKRPADADALLDLWQSEGASWPAGLSVLHGNVHRALGRLEAARDAYEKGISSGDSALHPIAEAVRTNMALAAFDRAYRILQEQRDTWLHAPAYEKLVAEFIEGLFGRASADAHSLLATLDQHEEDQRVAQMNAQLTASLALIVDSIENLEVRPARLGADAKGHVALLGDENLRQCTHYRIEQKQEQFHAAGIELRRHAMPHADAFLADLRGARAAIFYRLPATPDVIRAILTARRMGIPTYYEIDDLIFCFRGYPADYTSYRSEISPEEYRGLQFGVPLFRFAMHLCDRAIASTPALLEQMAPVVRDRTGLVVRNGLDSRNAPMIALGARPRSNASERVRIFYGSGTLAHAADFSELVAPTLARLLVEDAHIDIVLVGHVPHDPSLDRHADRVFRHGLVTDIEQYWALLSACDINLAMLHPDPVTNCKSEIKWLEAAVLGIPTVASDTATYCDVIDPDKDGMIAATPEQWQEKLQLLVRDAAMRRRIGAAAREKALTKYSLAQGASAWSAALSASPPSAPKAKRSRVLICNVFFSPQSIGGATRVVEDNVAHFAAEYPDLELAVFCTDDDLGTPGRLRTSEFAGVPVFRLAVPTTADVDSKPFEPANAAAFKEIVALFKPDLVHFHCVQRLTASIVRECLELEIPYLVTLHDAWWISPHQFLIDEDGLLRMPSADPFLDVARDPVAGVATLQRRRQLASLLAGARQVLAVSESFAEVYRRAGISPVRAIPNGVPDLPPCPEPDGARGLLRLGYIGGRTSHKGADLVEAALRRSDFRNLHLLIIDGRVRPGEEIHTQWGGTAVTIRAPLPQKDIASLYGSLDVLLAPSRWPESFGLVAREAAHFGLWVVASELGAIGEEIVEGQNGFRIGTTDSRDLERILRTMDSTPDRYRQGTARVAGASRSSRAQAADLAALYRGLARENDAVVAQAATLSGPGISA